MGGLDIPDIPRLVELDEPVGVLFVETLPNKPIRSPPEAEEDPLAWEAASLASALSRFLFSFSLNLKKSSSCSPFFSFSDLFEGRDEGSVGSPFRAEVLDLARLTSGLERFRPNVESGEGIVEMVVGRRVGHIGSSGFPGDDQADRVRWCRMNRGAEVSGISVL